uniref:Uncharacterized protein n=1 Tax=Arundo donax TaxID=35708 RepID=A0A0A8ZKC3_ARUDO
MTNLSAADQCSFGTTFLAQLMSSTFHLDC